jgi:hypothetical protein
MTKLILKDDDLSYDKITYDCEVFVKDHRLLTWLNKVFDTEFKKVYSTKNLNVRDNMLDTSCSRLLIVKQDGSVVVVSNYEFGEIEVF